VAGQDDAKTAVMKGRQEFWGFRVGSVIVVILLMVD